MLYGNTHRFLLRTISSQSVMSIKDIQNLIQKNAGNEKIDIPQMVQQINDNIKPLKQMIKIVKDEVTSEALVVFLSLGYDDASKAQNVFSPVDLEFFRLIMEQIMSTDTREIAELNAINLRNKVNVNNKLLGIVHAERLLKIWCNMQYLDLEDKNYALSVRAIHEFESYFSQTFANAASMKCYNCHSIVFRGYNCPYCPKTIHRRCLEASLKKAQKWPCCKHEYIDSELQALRGQRANETSRMTQQLEPTQPMDVTQPLNENTTVAESSDEEMDNDDGESVRPRKRRRI